MTSDEPSEQSDSSSDTNTHGHDRRTFLRTVGAVGGVLGLGALGNTAVAANPTVRSYLNQSGDVTIPKGTYAWQGSGISVSAGDSLVGAGLPGDVVWNLTSGTMDGYVEGQLSNIVVRGHNHQTKAGIDLYPGALVDGFVWPEGGQQPEDRAFYTPSGGSDPVTVRNSAWAWCANNGAYTDKPEMQYESCAAINNNICQYRIGHRDGTPSDAVSHIRDSIIAVTQEVATDGANSANARGIRLRQPADLVIENCWFVYLDVPGVANPIELHAPGNVTLKDCHFYHDAPTALIRDKTGGACNVTIQNCTIEGSGSRTVEPAYSGSGFTEASKPVPLPSEVTGYAAADDAAGVRGYGPWPKTGSTGAGGSPDNGSTGGTTSPPPNPSHTLVLHALADNPSPVDVSITVDGTIDYASEAEPGTDTIVENADGTMTATSISLDPDALDSYTYTGDVVSCTLPTGGLVDVSRDGTSIAWHDLCGDVTGGPRTGNDTGTGNSTDSGSGGSPSNNSSGGNSTGSGGNSTTPPPTPSPDYTKRILIDGRAGPDVADYTFTVSGDVERDASASVTGGSQPWDRLDDIAKNGKVIGVVADGVDAYRFSGMLTNVTIEGDASVSIQRL